MSAPPAPSPLPAPGSEYRTRLWMGTTMALLAGGILFLDQYLAPWYPCLLACIVLLTFLASLELHGLLSGLPRPPAWLFVSACLALVLANWPAMLGWTGTPPRPWRDLAWVFAGVILVGFLHEMATFREPGGVVVRLALLTWAAGYLGLLSAFFVQLRWLPSAETGDQGDGLRGVTTLALTIFVPKGADIGAYFTGRALGRHKMTPLLSPKKTWEGLAGGLVLAMLVAVGINECLVPVFGTKVEALAFGVVVGGVGVLGDLAESLIKRDCQKKDASQSVPGFGGVLDVIDSVLFAAPVAYWWTH